jgi:hypothetical protein
LQDQCQADGHAPARIRLEHHNQLSQFSPRIGAQGIFYAPIEDANIVLEAETRRVMVCCKTVRALMVQCVVQRTHINHRAQAPDWHIKLAQGLR